MTPEPIMTDVSEPSEAEVDAFVNAFGILRPSREDRVRIRAGLTAAAQVREGAPKFESGAAMRLNFIADQVQSWLDWSHKSRAKENLTTDGDTAIMALPVPIWPKHGSLQNWVKALREGAMIASLWQANRATEEPKS